MIMILIINIIVIVIIIILLLLARKSHLAVLGKRMSGFLIDCSLQWTKAALHIHASYDTPEVHKVRKNVKEEMDLAAVLLSSRFARKVRKLHTITQKRSTKYRHVNGSYRFWLHHHEMYCSKLFIACIKSAYYAYIFLWMLIMHSKIRSGKPCCRIYYCLLRRQCTFWIVAKKNALYLTWRTRIKKGAVALRSHISVIGCSLDKGSQTRGPRTSREQRPARDCLHRMFFFVIIFLISVVMSYTGMTCIKHFLLVGTPCGQHLLIL